MSREDLLAVLQRAYQRGYNTGYQLGVRAERFKDAAALDRARAREAA